LSLTEPRRAETGLITVLIVDDHAVVREGLRMLLEDAPGLAVVGEAGDGAAALAAALRLRPRVVVTDYSMPPPDGIELTRQLRAALPETRTIVLSFHDDADIIREALAAGAYAYVVKRAADSELEAAIRTAAAGRADGPQREPAV
jgi:two-component system response regulator NreC